MNKRYRLLPVVLAFAGLAAACSTSYDRADLIEELTTGDNPVSQEVANCVADGMEEQIGVDRLGDRGDPTEEEQAIITDVAITCVLGG